jgi:hypothetical protein
MDKDKRIKELEEELEKFKSSPYVDAYLGLYLTIKRWSGDLKGKHFSISASEEDDMKAFEKAHKASLSMKDLFEQLDYLKAKITPIQEENARKEATSIFEKALQSQGSLDENS